MEEATKKGMALFTKISIIFNTLLFGITGILYLIDKNNFIGIMLLAAGTMNIVYALVTLQTKNYFFAVLNFIFGIVSLIVCIDYLLQKLNLIGMVWLGITLYFLITGFVLVILIRNKKISKSD